MPEIKKILFYSPFSFLWPHALPEFQLADLLGQEGFDVKVIGCRGSYSSICTAMEAARVEVSADQSVKDEICRTCIRYSQSLGKSFSRLDFATAESYMSEDNDTEIAVEIPKAPDDMLNYSLDGVDIGRIALYETLLKFKKFNVELSSTERQYFKAFFLNAIKVLRQATRIIRAEKPDVVVCYSPQYVYPGVFAAVAAREGIRTIFIEGSSNDNERYSHLRMWDWEKHGLSQPALSVPERFASFTLSKKRAARAKKLMTTRRNAVAFSAYTSKAKNASPFEVFGLDSSKKYILLSMSSYDEVFSGCVINKLPLTRFEGRVFKNQIEWLRETIEWISARPELQMVVRPHPREFPNKRDMIASLHEKEWSSVLESLPPNVKIDHPNLKFSLYDHFDHIDALITGWSSTGVEALSRGIPVVSYDREITSFPASMHYTGSSKAEYFENILRARQDRNRDRNIQNALRWLAYTSEVGTVEIGGRFSDRFNILKLLRVRRILRERLSVKLDLVFPPSRRDVSRVLDMVRGKGSSSLRIGRTDWLTSS